MIDASLIQLLVAAGGGATLQAIGRALWQWGTGKHKRERDGIAYYRREMQTAYAVADDERRKRAIAVEYTYELRGVLVANGIDTDDIPGWPDGASTHNA